MRGATGSTATGPRSHSSNFSPPPHNRKTKTIAGPHVWEIIYEFLFVKNLFMLNIKIRTLTKGRLEYI